MRHCSRILRRTAAVLLGFALAGGFLRAASDKKFSEQRTALREKAKADQQRLGYSDEGEGRKKLFADHPSPQITLCKVVQVQAGGSATIEVSGAFEQGTTFLVDNDAVALASPASSGKSYRATVQVAPGLGPGFVRLHAFSPVSGACAQCEVVFVDRAQAYSLAANNGWKVLLKPQAKAFQMDRATARLAYDVEFYKTGEAKPFESLQAARQIGSGGTPDDSFYMSLQPRTSGAMAEIEKLQKMMSDPQSFMKMSPKEQEALLEKLTELSQQASKDMAGMTDIAALQRKQDEFGCSSVNISTAEDGKVTGTIDCGKNVGTLTFTGTAK